VQVKQTQKAHDRPRGVVMEAGRCTHLDQIQISPPDRVAGCEECLKTGDGWVHLRVCLTCGKVGCCDDSPNRHASRHASEDSHPLIRSAEAGEDWCWCYIDELAFVVEFEQS
jgi:uncharacterized UBP type Zn finger protein